LETSVADCATGADFCDAFVISTDSLYLLALLLAANHEAAERCFVAALDQAFKANAGFKEWAGLSPIRTQLLPRCVLQ
jgi:hypothetical protein